MDMYIHIEGYYMYVYTAWLGSAMKGWDDGKMDCPSRKKNGDACSPGEISGGHSVRKGNQNSPAGTPGGVQRQRQMFP